MTEKLQSIAKFDTYSDMRVPFDVATWFRAHKFSVPAVNALRCLKQIKEIDEQIAALEAKRELAEQGLKIHTDAGRKMMETANAV